MRYPLGHNKNPMQDADIEHKFRGLASRVYSPQKVDSLLKALWNFENVGSVTEVLQLFADDLNTGTLTEEEQRNGERSPAQAASR